VLIIRTALDNNRKCMSKVHFVNTMNVRVVVGTTMRLEIMLTDNERAMDKLTHYPYYSHVAPHLLIQEKEESVHFTG